MTGPEPRTAVLRMRLAFDDYLNARDLAEVLGLLDRIYDGLLYAAAPDLRELPSAEEARLRIRSVREGSILLELINGVSQFLGSTDPNLEIALAAPPTLAALGKVVRDTADWVIDFKRRRLELADDLRERQQELDADAAHLEFDLAEREQALRLRDGELRAELARRNLELLVRTNEVLRELTSSAALQQAALDQASAAIGADLGALQEVLLRSRITAASVEVTEEA